ncbi:MAG: YdbH domain-containing protein [Pseudomonadota bacterium]
MRRRWLLLPAVLLLLLLPPLTVYLLFPEIVSQAAERYGPEYGVEVAVIDVARPEFGKLEVRRLVLEAGRYRLTGSELQLAYTPGGLYRGGLEAMEAMDLELTVLDAATTGGEDAGEESPGSSTDADVLFALVPAERVHVERFRLTLPALDFTAAGKLTLDDESLEITFTTETPAVAKGVNLNATLNRSGAVTVDFRPAEPSARPFLSLRSEVPQENLEGSVEFDLADFSWALLTAGLGLPPGEAVVSGRGRFSLPWPLPESELEQSLSAEAELTGFWRGAELALSAHALSLAVTKGRFTVDGPVKAVREDAAAGLTWTVEEAAGALDGTGLSGSGPLALTLKEQGVSLAGAFSASGSLPTRRGELSFEGSLLAAEVQRPLTVDLSVAQEEAAISGRALLSSSPFLAVPLTFHFSLTDGSYLIEGQHQQAIDGGLLAMTLPEWSEPFDLQRGNLALTYLLRGSETQALGGELTFSIAEGDGFYESVAGRGLETELEARLDAGKLNFQPSSVSAALVDAGVPVYDFATTLAGDLAGDLAVLHIGPTRGDVLGGTLLVPAFDYDLPNGGAAFSVELDGLAVAEVLALEGENITGSGVLDGLLPLRLKEGEISVTAGQLTAREPGGVIRLNPRFADTLTQPGLDVAMQALTDFRFQRLEATADYSPEGDLVLGVRLEGSNPELEAGRPVHFNLTVSENIPVLLRSLRLKDEFTRRIEEQVTQ